MPGAAVLATGKQRVPDLLAGIAKVENAGAGGTGVWLLSARIISPGENLVDGAARPVKESAGARADRILADRAKEPLVRLPILPSKRLGLGEGDRANQVDEQAGHDRRIAPG